MIRTERFDDVTRYELTGWRNRVVKLSVSIFEVRGAWIDAGFHHASRDVSSMVESRRPRGVMITHRHEDHAGNAELLATLGVPLAIPAATAEALTASHPVGLYRRATWGSPPPLRSRVIPFAPNDLELRATPGHSEDHHVVWDPGTGTLFSADLYLGVRVRIAHAYEEPRKIVESLRLAASWEPQRMFDAHRGLIRKPKAALLTKAEWLEETISAIDNLIDEGASDDQIVRRLFRGFDMWGTISRGDYSQLNLVAAVRRGRVDSRR